MENEQSEKNIEEMLKEKMTPNQNQEEIIDKIRKSLLLGVKKTQSNISKDEMNKSENLSQSFLSYDIPKNSLEANAVIEKINAFFKKDNPDFTPIPLIENANTEPYNDKIKDILEDFIKNSPKVDTKNSVMLTSNILNKPYELSPEQIKIADRIANMRDFVFFKDRENKNKPKKD